MTEEERGPEEQHVREPEEQHGGEPEEQHSGEPEEQTGEREQDSVQRISDLLNELIDAQHQVQDTRNEEEMFRDSHGEPPPTQRVTFNDIEELAQHNERRAQYASELEEVTNRHQEAVRRYEAAVEEVKEVLPAGASVVHNYEGEGERAGRYQIARWVGPDDEVRVIRA
jgi:hypothetical protein